MELKTYDYQTPSLVEICFVQEGVICTSLDGGQLGKMTQEDDNNTWSDIL